VRRGIVTNCTGAEASSPRCCLQKCKQHQRRRSHSYARGGSILWMYWMASAACSRPNTKKEAKCSLISTALKPITGMLAAPQRGRVGSFLVCHGWRGNAQASERRPQATSHGLKEPMCKVCLPPRHRQALSETQAHSHRGHAPAASAPRMTQGAYAMYSQLDTRLNTMQARPGMGRRLAMTE